MTECFRGITFTILGVDGGPGVLVQAADHDGNIEFTVDVLDTDATTADLRGLFFHLDESFLPGLRIIYDTPLITEVQIAEDRVINLGNGADMNGAVQGGFDVGVEFGTQGIGRDDVNAPVTFTLDAVQDITVDALAHMLFGARLTSIGAPDGARNDSSKETFEAPAAPTAADDIGTTHEDVPLTIDVLANDTDPDGTTLFITDTDDGPAHGTVTIAADGRTLTYTPTEDYSGPDSFVYCISNGAGGTDYATVTLDIVPVADAPEVDIEVLDALPTDPVNLVRLRVTATQTDLDGSEFIDRIVFDGLPAGATVTTDGQLDDPGQPGSVTEFVELWLPLDQELAFNFGATAYSQERGNGDPDEASATALEPIEVDFTRTSFNRTFLADDRSIWENDQAIGFADSDFFGPDLIFGPNPEFTLPVPIPGTPLFVNATADVDGHFQFGLEYDIEINGGRVDAQAPIEVTLDSTYNRTTDTLHIDAQSFNLAGLSFQTEGPGGHFFLDALLDVMLNFDLSISLPVGPAIDVLPNGFDNITAFERLEIIHISDTSSISIPLPAGFSVTAAFPADVDASGTTGVPSSVVTGGDDSNNFLQIDWNLGVAASQFVPIIAPLFTPLPVVVLPLVGTITPIIATIGIGADFIQNFMLTMQGVSFDVILEDGTPYHLDPVNGVTIHDASQHDLDGNGLEYTLVMDPIARLNNDTDIGVNFTWNLDFLTANLTVPLPVSPILDVLEDIVDFIFGDDFDLPDSIGVNGPLIHLGQSEVPVTTIDVLNNEFALDFQSQNAMFVV